MDNHRLDYKIIRDKHPALTVYWIAESVERGRPVILNELSCIFCKRTITTDFVGSISAIINAPQTMAVGAAIGVRCKQCKQNYRFVYVDSYLG